MLRDRIKQLWKARKGTATLTSFLKEHKGWFYDEVPFA